ncbi:MAG: anti-sigma factor RsbA family regulatory protein [Candidatus Dormibacteraceae bacterium]
MNASAAREAPKFRHEALLYAGAAEFVAGTVPFIRGGLEAGEPVLVVESPDKIEMLRIALAGDAENVLFADMGQVGANPARIIPVWHEFVTRHAAPGRRLRGIGEPIWKGRSSDELVECQRHESLLNVAFGHGEPWWLLCPYDVNNLEPAVIDEAKRSHEFVRGHNVWQRSEAFRGLDASGAPFDVPLPEPATGVSQMVFGSRDLDSLRRVISRQARAARLNAARAAELVSAVNEVATNSIRHGGGSGTLRVWQERSAVFCEIRDRGRFDKPLADRERPSRDLAAPRGLWLVNQLCDLVQIRSMPDGTVVRLQMNRHPNQRLHLVQDVQGDGSHIN